MYYGPLMLLESDQNCWMVKLGLNQLTVYENKRFSTASFSGHEGGMMGNRRAIRRPDVRRYIKIGTISKAKCLVLKNTYTETRADPPFW